MPQTGPIILRVAVPTPLRRTFDYIFPEKLITKLEGNLPLVGSRVTVEFGRRTLVALIIEVTDSSDIALEKLKPINDILDLSKLKDIFNIGISIFIFLVFMISTKQEKLNLLNREHFKLIFYFIAISFGLIHIINFHNINYYLIFFYPFYLLPQIFMGIL